MARSRPSPQRCGRRPPPRPLRWPCPVLLALLPAGALGQRPCPKDDGRGRSPTGATEQVKLEFVNEARTALSVFWVDSDGGERRVATLGYKERRGETSFRGHVFKVRSKAGRLVQLVTASGGHGLNEVRLEGCDGLEEAGTDTSRWPEFERLVADPSSPCEGPSSKWSCVRHVTPEELRARKAEEFGFSEEEARGTQGKHKPGDTLDPASLDQQPFIPNVTSYEKGYLKMEMTDRMKAIFYPWFHERKKDSVVQHKAIQGFFTNSFKLPFDKIDLDTFPDVHQAIIDELREVLEWWTKTPLRHTTTFGVRIYRRGAMLVNHVDRKSTHLVSAIMQVGQTVDEGWPLEVLHPHVPGLTEVYLQPGQVVLYEGARLLHGRPKRFNGDEFANVFSHFVPLWYEGPLNHACEHYKSGFAPRPPSAEL